MILSKSSTAVETPTVHITRHSTGKRYKVWLFEKELGATDDLSKARKLARASKAPELVECWERGKAFERSPRGAWKVVS